MANLGARVGLWVLLGFLAVGFLASLGTVGSGEDEASATPARVDRYLDRVAAQLAEPGVFVEPRLVPAGALTREQALALDATAQTADAPLRVAVLPEQRLRAADGQPLEPDRVVAELRQRIDADGVFAAIVRRPDGDLRLAAEQVGDKAPRYEVAEAVDAASTCCSSDVARTLGSFLDRVETELTTPAQWALRGAAVLALLAAAAGALVWRRRYAARTRRDDRAVELLRGPLGDEVGEVAARAAALPPVDPKPADERGDDLGPHVRSVHRLVARARSGHRGMVTAEDAEQVTRTLSDIRHELAVVEAIREGRPVPDRTPACYLDPRHGPSASVEPYTPTGGTERDVPVCAACRAALEVGQRPHIRRLQRAPGTWAFYWDVGDLGAPYVSGYWPEAGPERKDRRQPADSLRH